METFEEFVSTIKDQVRSVGEGFTAPDDDWVATMILFSKESGVTVAMLDPDFFASEVHKEVLATQVMPGLVKQTGAEKVAFITSCWALYLDKEQAQEYMRNGVPADGSPSNSPERVELVQITCVSADEAFCSSARIFRDGEQPPALQQWEDTDAMSTQGRFLDGLRLAFA
jgi:hypothetical protein